MNKINNKIKPTASERLLKMVAYSLTVLFIGFLLYPLLYTVSSSAKDHVKIYDVPPSILPDPANSMSIVVDYSHIDDRDPDRLLDILMKDHVISMFVTDNLFQRDSVYEIKFYGTMDGKTIFYSRAHKMKLQLERDFGVYRGSVLRQEVLHYGDRYIRASQDLGYEFNPDGLKRQPQLEGMKSQHFSKLDETLSGNYSLQGDLISSGEEIRNILILESYGYYLRLPSYAYSDNPLVAKYSFLVFVFNSFLVIGWAIVSQVILCSLTAFVISRLLSKRAGNFVLLYFLGAMMIPFASIMLPQLIMYQNLGFYNNYLGLIIPFLYPFGFFIYLFKGFFDRIPGELFEAGRMDGASNLFLYTKICMPLSTPIIMLIVLRVFIGNWNDFFWAWLVTESQNLWTLNVALYNLSNHASTKQNFIMGLSIITILPVILGIIITSKQLKQSVMSSGVKG